MAAADLIALASAGVAALALVVSVLFTWMNLRWQRRLVHEERVWDTRSRLYVDLLVWLDGKTATAERVRDHLMQLRRAKDREAERQWLETMITSLTTGGPSPADPAVSGSGNSSAVQDVKL